MPTNVPPSLPPASRRNIERGLRELRAWRAVARDDYRNAVGASKDERRRLRQLVDDLEWLCYRLEQVLHPASTSDPDDRGRDDKEGNR